MLTPTIQADAIRTESGLVLPRELMVVAADAPGSSDRMRLRRGVGGRSAWRALHCAVARLRATTGLG